MSWVLAADGSGVFDNIFPWKERRRRLRGQLSRGFSREQQKENGKRWKSYI